MARTWNAARRVVLSGASSAVMLLAAGNGLAQTSGAASQAPADGADNVLEELIVTGTSIRGVPPVGSNLISVTREDIEAIGAVSTPDLVATVPQLNSFNTAPQA